jgi:hypothetical protein
MPKTNRKLGRMYIDTFTSNKANTSREFPEKKNHIFTCQIFAP